MNNIKIYKNPNEFKKYLQTLKGVYVGEGSEGKVYRINNDEIFKKYIYYDEYMREIYNKDMLMESDLKLDSFIFPREMHITNKGIVLGYKAKYFPNNMLDPLDIPDNLNIDALIKARLKFIEDTKVITEYGYYLYELANNLMFDNNTLVAIDTLDYKRRKVTLEENISIIDYAILTQLQYKFPYIDNLGEFDKEIDKVYKKTLHRF